MADLTFHRTLTIAEFKAGESVDRIELYRSPKTNKLAFTSYKADGEKAASGAGSESAEHAEVLAISIVSKPGEDDKFYLIHERKQNNVLRVL